VAGGVLVEVSVGAGVLGGSVGVTIGVAVSVGLGVTGGVAVGVGSSYVSAAGTSRYTPLASLPCAAYRRTVTGPAAWGGVVNSAAAAVDPALRLTVVVSTTMLAVPIAAPAIVRVSPPVVSAVA
jgi:hypothetical protein